uniref:Uncharacterized protein n=1 Tax=viral metagenome TaxID=1070528 RepID=A0A6C0H576_9ZZZZ
MSLPTHLPPKINNPIFNTKDFEWTNEDIIISINKLNVKYEQNIKELDVKYKQDINELKNRIEKLTCLVNDLQKINTRVDEKTTEITNGIQQIIENN